MDLRIADKNEIDHFPVLVKPRMNKGLFASQLLSPQWFITICNRPCYEGRGWLDLAVDPPNPTSKCEVIVRRVLREGPQDDVYPGLVVGGMLVKSGERYGIRIPVSSDERLDQPIVAPALGTGQVLPVRLAI